MKELLCRIWFTRIWPVQKAALVRRTTLAYGQHQISWRADVQTVRSIIYRIKATIISPELKGDTRTIRCVDWSPLPEIFEPQLRQAARREGIVLRRNHLDLAYEFRDRKCSDPRDKYFARLGIIEDDDGEQ